MGTVTTEYAEKLMKRCQIGTRNYNEANDLHAACYETIGALVQERDMLRTGDTCARQCEGTAYRIELRRLQREMPDLSAVIAWLENGCDPKEAANELRIYQQRMRSNAKLTGKAGTPDLSD